MDSTLRVVSGPVPVGVLLPAALRPRALGQALIDFYKRPAAEKRKLGSQAHKEYTEK